MADVEFQDFSIQVNKALDSACFKFLEEAASEFQSAAVRNTKVGKVSGGKTKGAWKHFVNEAKKEATVGNTDENAIWEEFGTGEYALKGNGHRGGWYIPIGNGERQISQAVVDAYGFEVVEGKNGQKFAFTKGKKPKRMLHNAFEKNKGKVIKRAKQIFKEELGE